MTANNINYWGYRENQRHNLAMEDYYQDSLAETKRHNVATETTANEQVKVAWANNQVAWANNQLGWSQLDETIRHNKASESISWANVDLGWANVNETRRHNLATEQNQLLATNLQFKTNMRGQDIQKDKLLLDEYLGKANLTNQAQNVYNSSLQAQAAQQNADTNSRNSWWGIVKDVGKSVSHVIDAAWLLIG